MGVNSKDGGVCKAGKAWIKVSHLLEVIWIEDVKVSHTERGQAKNIHRSLCRCDVLKKKMKFSCN